MVKMKKRGGRWLVYRRKDQMCICPNKETAKFWREVLKSSK